MGIIELIVTGLWDTQRERREREWERMNEKKKHKK
jgi:hypothetical protein